MNKIISLLESSIADPKKGLPDEIFYFVGRLTPYINVDLLVKDVNNKIFFSWRDDCYTGKGWHLPGGIIRYKETIEKRIIAVARNEIGISLISFKGPVEVNEVIDYNSKERAHFISLLFICKADFESSLYMENLVKNDADKYLLSSKSPENLLSNHKIYEKYFISDF
jgi:ADP-ribose pyrophosphatase YjhB (NUDIX family)